MNKVLETWERALPYIKENISETGFKTTFEKLTPTYIQEDTIFLSTTNKLYKDMFNGIYEDITRNALLKTTGTLYNIKILIEEEPQTATKPQDDVSESDPFSTQSDLNPKFTFDNFIVGSNSEFAYAAAYAITMGAPKDEYNPLFIYGGSGLGKTHLLHAVGNEILKNDPGKKILCVTAETFMNAFIESIKNETNTEFRNKFRNIDVLLIDDIQFFAGKEGTQEEFFHTFNELIAKNKQIMITSDRPPKDISPLEERLRTRLSSRIMADIQPPDFETRLAILHSKVHNNPFSGEISDEIFNLIAQQIKSNIRELEGAIRTVIAYSDISKKEVDVETANKILKDYFQGAQKRKIDAEYIIREVEKHFNLSGDTIISTKRDRIYTFPRQVAMYIVRELTQLSLPEIGREFKKDHSTVMHNINKIKLEMQKDLSTMNTINDLMKNIKNDD